MRIWTRKPTGMFVVLALGSCAQTGAGNPAAPAPVPPDNPDALTLTVSGSVRSAGTSSPIATTKVLHSGELLNLALRSSRAANAYVAYCDATRALRVYPVGGALAIGPDRDVRVPETQDFRVDTNTGLETIYVIASTEPLHATDPRLARVLLAAESNSNKLPCAPELRLTTAESRRAEGLTTESDPGPGSTSATRRPAASGTRSTTAIPEVPGFYRPRGFELVGAAPSELSTQSDEAGIAILALTFQHDP